MLFRSIVSNHTTLLLFGLLTALLVLSGLYLTIGAQGSWSFVLSLRGKKLLLLVTVAWAVGASTLLFQTLTHNPILTPSILGFDALYLLLQSVLVFSLGGIGFTQFGGVSRFLLESLFMTGCSGLLFFTLMRHSHGDLAKLILVGVIFGILFRSLNNMLQRMIDPNVFTIAQTKMFAQFTSVNPVLLNIGMMAMLISAVWIWRIRYQLDIIMLGRPVAIGLGIHYQRQSISILIGVALLVSVSTALVGPVSFFGLLVCAIANVISPSMHHHLRIPLTFLVAAITLVLGQLIFEQLLGMKAVLGVVIEFLGGLVFIWLIMHKKPTLH